MAIPFLDIDGRPGPTARPALVTADRTVSFRDLAAACRSVATRLAAARIHPGDRVALRLPNSPEFVAALLGALHRGAQVLLVDPKVKETELRPVCRRVGIAALLTGDEADSDCPTIPIPPLAELLDADDREAAAGDHGESGAFLLMSSGTTGTPKVVVRTVAQAAAAVDIFRRTVPYRSDDRILATLPMVHSFGLLNVLLTGLSAGAAIYLNRFSPRPTAAAIVANRITVLPGTPFLFRMLAETGFRTAPDFSSVRLAISAGSALSPAIAALFEDKFGVSILQSYGSTESGPVAVGDAAASAAKANGNVGRPYAGVKIEIRDDASKPVAERREGLVAATSPALASGYLEDPQATAEVFVKGYVLTGDIGYLQDGELHILGRKRRLISVAGKKVAPAEVEACLRAHPAVADVVVSGVQAGRSERIQAVVVRAQPVSVQELRTHCSESLAAFKTPHIIEFAANLSQGIMGKPKQVDD